jgi:hypothetical protein
LPEHVRVHSRQADTGCCGEAAPPAGGGVAIIRRRDR